MPFSAALLAFAACEEYDQSCYYPAPDPKSDIGKALTANTEYIYSIYNDDSYQLHQGVEVTELASGEVKILLDQTVSLYTSDICGNVVTFSYIDKKTQLEQYGSIDLDTEKITDFPFAGSFYSINHVNDIWMAS